MINRTRHELVGIALKALNGAQDDADELAIGIESGDLDADGEPIPYDAALPLRAIRPQSLAREQYEQAWKTRQESRR